MYKVVLIVIASMVFVGCNLVYAQEAALGAGFQGTLNATILTQPSSQSAKQEKKKPAGAKKIVTNKKTQTYEEFVAVRKSKQPSEPSQDDFKQIVEQAKLQASLEGFLLTMDYKAFKRSLIDALKTRFGNNIDEKLKKLPTLSQGKFKKLALAKQYQVRVNRTLEEGNYDAYLEILKTSKAKIGVITKDEFQKLSEKAKKHKAVLNAIMANDYSDFVDARKAEQPALPTREEFDTKKK